MALTNVWRAGPAKINGAVISGITQSAASNGVSTTNPIESTNLWPNFSAVTGVKQGGTFTTRDIFATLTATGVSGVAISSATELWYKKHGPVGPASGSVHRKYLYGAGVVCPLSMSCSHQGNASMSAGIIAVSSDGSANAVAVSDNNALPTDPTSKTYVYTLYSVTFAGTERDGLVDTSIDFGCNARTVGSNSNLLDVLAGVTAVVPSASVTFLSIDDGDALWQGLSGAHVFTFRRRGSALTSTDHIQITIDGVAYAESMADGSATGDSEASAVARVVSNTDGTNAPLVVDLAYQISGS